MKKQLILLLVALLFISCGNKQKENQNPLISYVPENTNYFIGNLDNYNPKILEKSQKDLETLLNSSLLQRLPINIKNILKVLPEVIDGNVAVYGELLPTIRVGLKDTKKLKETLIKENIKIEKCDTYECIKIDKITVLFLDNHLIATIDNHSEYNLLETKPENQYDYDSLLKKEKINAYSSLSKKMENHKFLKDNILGYVNIEKLVKSNIKECGVLIGDIAKNMPQLSFGMTKYDTKGISSKTIISTSKSLATKLQGISSNVSSKLNSSDAIVNLLLALDIKNTVSLIGELADFVGGYSSSCKAIDSGMVSKIKTGLAFSSFMGIDKLQALNILVSSVSKDGVDAKVRVELNTKASEFFDTMSSFVPSLSGTKIEDDKEINIPYSSLFKNSPSISIMSNNNFLEIRTGKNIKTEDVSMDKDGTIISTNINYKKYFEMVLNMMPLSMRSSIDKNTTDLLPQTINYKLYISNKGVNIDANIQR